MAAPSGGSQGAMPDRLGKPRSFWSVFAGQAVGIAAKNFAMIFRQRVRLFTTFALPIVFILGLYGSVSALSTQILTEHSLVLEKCTAFDVYSRPTIQLPCVTLAFSPNKKGSFVSRVMERVASDHGLEMGTDVVGFSSKQEAAKYLYGSINKRSVDIVVAFDTGLGNETAHSHVYELWYNQTLAQAYSSQTNAAMWEQMGLDKRLLSTQAAVDAAIIAETGKSLSTSVSSSSSTPSISSTFEAIPGFNPLNTLSGGPGTLIMVLAGSAFVVLGFVSSAILVLTVVTGEKTRKLLGALRAVGLLESAYWISWFLAYGLLFCVVAIVAMGIGYATKLPIFTQTYFSIHWFSSSALGVGVVAMALCCASCLKKPMYVNTCAFCIFAVAATMTILFGVFGLYDTIYTPSTSPFFQMIVTPFPWFFYGAYFRHVLTTVYKMNSGAQAQSPAPIASEPLYSHLNPSLPPAPPSYEQVEIGFWELVDEGEEEVGSGDSTIVGDFGYAESETFTPFSNETFVHNEGVKGGHKSTSFSTSSTNPTSKRGAPASVEEELREKVLRVFAGLVRDLGLGKVKGMRGLWAWAMEQADRTLLGNGEWLDGITYTIVARGEEEVRKVHAFYVKEGVEEDAGVQYDAEEEEDGDEGVNDAAIRMVRHLKAIGESNDVGRDVSSAKSSLDFGTFTWKDFQKVGKKKTAVVNGNYVSYHPHSPAWYIATSIWVSFGYIVLAWYLSQVGKSDLGAAQPFYFPFSPLYWGCSRKRGAVEEGDTLELLQQMSGHEHSIRVHKLSKTFDGLQALKEVSLTLAPGQLFALLGQNGSGKSTFVKVLSGLLDPTNGEAFLFGRSIRTQAAELRDHMGACPQDDLLWEELSAREHLMLFARFKGVGLWESELEEHVAERLKDVALTKVADSPVMTFSGGMKRRLSVAIASVGNPSLIVLDEPSTGLDPVARRRIWQLIERLKQDRVLILTTHDLNEADYLGDNVGILASGRLRAVGTPLYLKSNFGAGFQLSLTASPARTAELKALVKRYLPRAEIVGELDASTQATALAHSDATGLGIGVAGAAAARGMDVSNLYSAQATSAMPPGAYASLNRSGAPNVPDAGDVLASRAASGSVTVAVPRADVAALPPFLRVLASFDREEEMEAKKEGGGKEKKKGKLVKEWGVSNSTLEEVFLRLAAQSNTVNSGAVSEAPGGDAGAGGGVPPVPVVGGGAGIGAAGGAGEVRALDGAVRDASVRALNNAAMSTKGSVSWPPITLYQGKSVSCIAYVIQDDTSKDKETVDVVREEVSKKAKDIDDACAARGHPSSGEPATKPKSSSTGSFAGGAAGGGGEDDGGEELPDALYRGKGEDGGDLSFKEAVAAEAEAAKEFEAVSEVTNTALDPVPLWKQALAVSLMRFQLLSKARVAMICYGLLAIIGIVVAVLVAPQVAPPTGTIQCKGQPYYSLDPSSCSESGFSDFLTNALSRYISYSSLDTVGEDPPPDRNIAFGTLRYDCISEAPGGYCDTYTETSNYPPSAAGATGSTIYQDNVTDFEDMLDFITRPVPTSSAFYPPPQFWVYDAHGSNDIGVKDMDLLGLGTKSLGAEGRLEIIVQGKSSGNDLDKVSKLAYEGQEKLFKMFQDSDFDKCGFGPHFKSEQTALDFFNKYFPDVAISFSKADPNPSKPQFSYSVLMWALFQYGPTSNAANRPSYNWAQATYHPNDTSTCYSADVASMPDTVWDNPLNINSPLPANALLNALHTGFLRAVVRKANDDALGNVPQDEDRHKRNLRQEQIDGVIGSVVEEGDVEESDEVEDPEADPYYTPRAETPSIATFFANFPPIYFIAKARGSTESYASLLWPLFTLFLFPGFVYQIAFEKQKRLFVMFSIAGGMPSAYWLGTWLYHVILYSIVCGIYVGAGYISGATPFANAGPQLFVALILTWAHAQSGFAILVGSLIRSPMAAIIFASVFVIVISLAGWIIQSVVSPWPAGASWVPFLAYTRAGVLIQYYGGGVVEFGSELQGTFLIQLLEGTVALVLGIYLHATLPADEQGGVPAHPLYFLEWCGLQPPQSLSELVTCSCCRRHAKPAPPAPSSSSAPLSSDSPLLGSTSTMNPLSASEEGGVWGVEDEEDPSVALERAKVNGGIELDELGLVSGGESGVRLYNAATDAVVIKHLRKDFATRLSMAPTSGHAQIFTRFLHLLEDVTGLPIAPRGTKKAVDDINFGVQYGECFSLLGPNGAGKTTALSILSGNSAATSGSAAVGGFNCATELGQVYRALGVCPQFDVVWDELTVREHLTFYARVKGVPERRISAEVQNVAERVQLDGDAFSLAASELSGGMRRRLSIGIALTGSPRCAVFDEPSTGLDPENKRLIWTILQGEKRRGIAMILITHSMQEASTLSDRIGIMHSGKLRCVGTQHRLRGRFGDGYKLSLNLRSTSPEHFSAAEQFVREHIARDAIKTGSVGIALSFALPRRGVDIAQMFQTFEDAKRNPEFPIRDWGVSESTLEDVFIKIVERSERSLPPEAVDWE